MKYLALFIAALLAFSCISDGDEDVIDVGFDFGIKDMEGADLLDPENPDGIDESGIKLFYLIDGEVQEFYEDHLAYPRNFFISEHEGEYRIRFFLNHADSGEFTMTYIKWNETDTDTLRSEIYRSADGNAVRLRKVWLNGGLIWDSSDKTLPYQFHELIK